jgi:hypothetical protein
MASASSELRISAFPVSMLIRIKSLLPAILDKILCLEKYISFGDLLIVAACNNP